jgi:hypothetical protein
VAIVQSNYIPWKGYFDLINMADEFVLLDEVQYTRRDWRNRNYIKTHNGRLWLTIPVQVKDKYYQRISETRVSDCSWAAKHWAALKHNYAKAKYFAEFRSTFGALYQEVAAEEFLSKINYRFLVAICQILGIRTTISQSSDYHLADGSSERLLDLCKQAGATTYLSGPAAKTYLAEELFQQQNISVHWMDYSGYREYQQLHPPFNHYVSIVDLIFNEGPNAPQYMLSF